MFLLITKEKSLFIPGISTCLEWTNHWWTDVKSVTDHQGAFWSDHSNHTSRWAGTHLTHIVCYLIASASWCIPYNRIINTTCLLIWWQDANAWKSNAYKMERSFDVCGCSETRCLILVRAEDSVQRKLDYSTYKQTIHCILGSLIWLHSRPRSPAVLVLWIGFLTSL